MTLKQIITAVVCGALSQMLSAQPSVWGQTLQPLNSNSMVQTASYQSPVQPGLDDNLHILQQETESRLPFEMTSRFHIQSGTHTGYLVLQIDMPSDSYVYSLTQSGTLNPIEITVAPSPQFKVSGPFHPAVPATVIDNDPIFNERVEKHLGPIQFFVPVQMAENVELDQIQPVVIFNGQVCSDQGTCIPVQSKAIAAQFAGFFERTAQRQSQPTLNQ